MGNPEIRNKDRISKSDSGNGSGSGSGVDYKTNTNTNTGDIVHVGANLSDRASPIGESDVPNGQLDYDV